MHYIYNFKKILKAPETLQLATSCLVFPITLWGGRVRTSQLGQKRNDSRKGLSRIPFCLSTSQVRFVFTLLRQLQQYLTPKHNLSSQRTPPREKGVFLISVAFLLVRLLPWFCILSGLFIYTFRLFFLFKSTGD